MKAFAMSFEAGLSFLLLLSALAIVQFFAPAKFSQSDFFLCLDVAQILVESSAFSEERMLESMLQEASFLSGLCIQASHFSTCSYERQEKLSIHFPVWANGSIASQSVSCWRH
ncbi:MAG: hypothetical protein N3G80_04305 [Candidatus Micrarchaeota archaeon]|nr:hypothetical protein [Candidatus Micrarchaeota archaeon]